jgi:hypothetical protein
VPKIDEHERLRVEAIAQKRRIGTIAASAAWFGPPALKSWQLRPSAIAHGAIEIRRFSAIVYSVLG